MRKFFTSVFLVGLLGIAWNSVWAQDDGRLSFGVISDIHIENNTGQGAMYKVPRALKNLWQTQEMPMSMRRLQASSRMRLTSPTPWVHCSS